MVRPVAGAARDIGVDRARAEHRDTDIGAFQLMLQRLGQRERGVFAHGIRPLVGSAAVLKSGDRGRVDDVPLLAVLQDRGHEVADAMNDPPDVHADHEFPVARRHIDQLCAVHGHAGVVAGDMKLAEVAFRFRQGIDNRLFLRHVDPHRHDPLVGAGQTMGGLLDGILLDVGHDDVGAGFRKRGRNAKANAGGRAGDDGGLAGDVHSERSSMRVASACHARPCGAIPTSRNLASAPSPRHDRTLMDWRLQVCHRGPVSHVACGPLVFPAPQSPGVTRLPLAGSTGVMSAPTPTARATVPSWAREFRAIVALSWPLALGNLTQVAMGTTDVMMMGWLSADTLAAGALGANLYFIAFVFGIGLLNAATPMIARDLGRDPSVTAPIRATVHAGLWSAFFIALPCWLALWWSESLLLAMGQEPALSALAGTYVHTLQWALLPAWGFIVLRSFISALERPVWSFVIGFGAVGLNAAANWCLMLGHCGCHPLGIAGSGLATSLSSLFMVLALGIVATVARPFARFRLFYAVRCPDWPRLREFWRLGLPMAATLSFEVTLFNAAVFLMGLISAASLAAHSIAIQLASLTFMVPLGIGQAATVRVGRALGRGDREAIRRAGWTALGLATAFMAAMSLTMVAAPRLLISAFLDTDAPGNARSSDMRCRS